MMLPLVLLFIAVPLAELAVIIQVGQAIGVWWTIGLLLADSILGSWLMRHQGRTTWRRFNAALQEGRVPTREVLDGALVIFGGALLLTPGFITDIFGLILLIPPTRAIVRGLLKRFTIGRFLVVGMPGGGQFGAPREPGSQGPSRDYDFDVSAEEIPVDGSGKELPRTDDN
jgi:UPF0716 protein FxsA